MGKTSQEGLWQRRVRILARVISDRSVSVKELKQTWGISSKATLQNDIDELRSLGIPIVLSGNNVVTPATGIEDLWRGTVVGARFDRKDSMDVKRRLADWVVVHVKEHKTSIDSLMVGTGTTAYVVAERILAFRQELGITAIYTANALVMLAYAAHQPHDVILRVVGGHLDRDIGWFRGDQGVDELRNQQVDAVITSFLGLSEKGFWTTEEYEVSEKLMNLQPHPDCHFVLIPIEWRKLAHEQGILVAPRGGPAEDAFDFLDGRRKYFIITDVPAAPENDKDRERFELLDYWEDKYKGTPYDGCVKVVRVP